MEIKIVKATIVRVIKGNDTWTIYQSYGVDMVTYIAILRNGGKTLPYIMEGDSEVIKVFGQEVLDVLITSRDVKD